MMMIPFVIPGTNWEWESERVREKVEYVYEKGEKKTSKPMTRLGSTGSRLMMMSLRSAPNINMMEQEEKKTEGKENKNRGKKRG